MNEIVLTREMREARLEGMGCKRKRVEDIRFTQGKGNYVDDVKLPNTLHGDFVRSPHAHARIKRIDVTKAKALPGVVAVLTADDLKPLGLHWMPTLAGDVAAVLADGKVHFQNQEVVFIVAENRYIADDAVQLVEVEYEALPVLVDPFKSMDDDAPVLREDLAGKTSGAHGQRKHHNHIFEWTVGDKQATDEAFNKAEVTIKELIPYHRTHPCPLETCQCLASFDKIKGELTLYGTFQAPHVIRTVASLLSKIPEHKISRHRAGYRRRFRQQGRRLFGLYLRDRCVDRYRRAGEMGGRSHREPLDHLVRTRLSHDDRNRRDEERPCYRPAGACPRRSRGLRRLR